MPQAGAALALKVIGVLYGYTLVMASANVVNCETRKPLECGDQWTLAFSVASGAITTLWGYLAEAPTRRSSASTAEPLPDAQRPKQSGPLPRP